MIIKARDSILWICSRQQGELICSRQLAKGYDINPINSTHVETVALLSQRRADTHICIDLDLDDLDITSAEMKATYSEIKEYVLNKFGLHVSSLYIAQTKEKLGMPRRENFNKGKEGHRVPNCPKEKEEAIIDALKYFKMI